MNILFALNHPAHFYLFKNPSLELQKLGHNVFIVYKQKDVLEELLKNFEIKSVRISRKKSGQHSKLFIAIFRLLEMISQDFSLLREVRSFKPSLMAGTDISISHIGKLLGIPSFIFNEDDIAVNKMFCKATYPFADFIVSPFVCNTGKYSAKKIPYNGYQKLAYLHPRWFSPDRNIVEKKIPLDKPYFLIRRVSFSAGHDIEELHSGLTDQLLVGLINILSEKGNVYISSEEPLNERFKKFILKINPSEIHNFIYFADLLIADSQSMIVESSVLGTPSIRFNSFVGKISVLEELETKYQLTCGISNNEENLLLDKTKEMADNKELKKLYSERRNKMLADKIDLASFIVWLLGSYPESVKRVRIDPSVSDSFKELI